MTNFLQWDPGQTNQENDATYTADPQRTGGAVDGQPFPAVLGNKAMYQWSTMVTAIAQAFEAKGFSVTDTSLPALVAVLANILTQADLVPYAPKNSPALTGTPTSPSPSYNDGSPRIATMAAVNGQPIQLAANGFIKFGNGLIIQWMIGPNDPNSGEPVHNVNFPTPFPNNCFICQVSMDLTSNSINADFWYQTFGWNTIGVNYQRQVPTGGSVGGAGSRAIIIAIGN